jgi:hypothetical protein
VVGNVASVVVVAFLRTASPGMLVVLLAALLAMLVALLLLLLATSAGQ